MMEELDESAKKLVKEVLIKLYKASSDETIVEDEDGKWQKLSNSISFGHRNAFLLVANRLNIEVHTSELPRDSFAEAMNSVGWEEVVEELGR